MFKKLNLFVVIALSITAVLCISCEKEEIFHEESVSTSTLSQSKLEMVEVYWKGNSVTANKVGEEYFIGDISIVPDHLFGKAVGIDPTKRSDHIWPNNTMIYTIDQELINSDQVAGDNRVERIREAMNIIESNTVIRFKERTNEEFFVKFVPGISPSSKIGMKTTPGFIFRNIGQELKLSIRVPTYTIIHEIMHALGFYHEQSRPDRDNFININYNNVSSSSHSQFDVAPWGFDKQYGNFDWNSIMLYNSYTAAIDRSVPVMTRKDGSTWDVNTSLSSQDIQAINSLYSGQGSNDNLPADVSSSYWAYNEIAFMWQNEYIKGNDGVSYRPNDNLTRAQFAALIASIINPVPIRSDRNFSDVPSNFWAKEAISKAVRGGYISGYPDGTFRPNENVTKLQMTIALSNGLGLSGGNSNHLQLFSDRSQIPSWAASSVQNATANRFVANYPNRSFFTPNKNATRAEAAVIFYQTLVKLGRASFINNTYLILP